MQPRILLFQDGAKFKSPPEKWRFINVLTHALIRLIQEPGFEYVIVDPSVCAEKLQEKVRPRDFSCAIDLSGLFGPSLKREGIPTFDDFRLSRLRKTSSPLLDGVGFKISVTQERTAQIREHIKQIIKDDPRPILVLDDVGWSGRTVRQTTTMLGIKPHRTTIGFLAGNRGTFGGAKTEIENLQQEGFSIVTGADIFTPDDDGFHLADFFIGDEANFDSILEIQILREGSASFPHEDSEKKHKDTLRGIQQILEKNQKKLFPNSIDSETARKMTQEGTIIIRGGISNNSFFDVNPPNWVMPSFSKRISSTTLTKNRRDIIDVVSELQELLEFPREDKELQIEQAEGRMGKERL
ncbi:MAG: hypothetical protein HYU48_02365 [Candidatus Levybacteria bacterium]|nr:hypothetical protein [Candidatus Levybacteria bacterium]